jgi:hypothetical protein
MLCTMARPFGVQIQIRAIRTVGLKQMKSKHEAWREYRPAPVQEEDLSRTAYRLARDEEAGSALLMTLR